LIAELIDMGEEAMGNLASLDTVTTLLLPLVSGVLAVEAGDACEEPSADTPACSFPFLSGAEVDCGVA
jgi:hypothetical protein